MPILKVFLFHTVKYPIVPVCYLPFIQNYFYPLRNNQVNLMFFIRSACYICDKSRIYSHSLRNNQVNLMFLALPKFACIRWK